MNEAGRVVEIADKGNALVMELLKLVVAQATEEELLSLPAPSRGLTAREKTCVLIAWGARMHEQRTENWFHDRCLEVLRGLAVDPV